MTNKYGSLQDSSTSEIALIFSIIQQTDNSMTLNITTKKEAKQTLSLLSSAKTKEAAMEKPPWFTTLLFFPLWHSDILWHCRPPSTKILSRMNVALKCGNKTIRLILGALVGILRSNLTAILETKIGKQFEKIKMLSISGIYHLLLNLECAILEKTETCSSLWLTHLQESASTVQVSAATVYFHLWHLNKTHHGKNWQHSVFTLA